MYGYNKRSKPAVRDRCINKSRMKNRQSAVISCLLVVCVPLSSAWCIELQLRNTARGKKVPALSAEKKSSSVAQPFGRKEYWKGAYRESKSDFSWYAAWNDLEPFLQEFVPRKECHILIPGIGTDAALLRDMSTSGYIHLSAFDYAEESITYLQQHHRDVPQSIALSIADVRNLTGCYEIDSFEAVLDKGTLDAVYLAGQGVNERQDNLQRAVRELHRILKPGGILLSLSGICADALLDCDSWNSGKNTAWKCLSDGSSIYTTAAGYTSNNLHGTLIVWQKK